VPQILELAQLIDEYSVSEMQVRRGWSKPAFDAQPPPGFQALPRARFLSKFHPRRA